MKDNGDLVNGPNGVCSYSADQMYISASRNWLTPQTLFTHSWGAQFRCLQAHPRCCPYTVMEKWTPLLRLMESIASLREEAVPCSLNSHLHRINSPMWAVCDLCFPMWTTKAHEREAALLWGLPQTSFDFLLAISQNRYTNLHEANKRGCLIPVG